MTNLWILKKRRTQVGRLLRLAREKRSSRKWIMALEEARESLNYKIEKLRKTKKVKK